MTHFALLSLLLLPAPVGDSDEPNLTVWPDGRCKVLVAGKTEFDSKTIVYGSGPDQTIRRNIAKWQPPRQQGVTYSVTFADYPEAFAAVPPKTLLDAARDGLRGPEGLGGSVESDKPVELKDAAGKKLTGRAVTVKARTNWVRARLVVVGTRLYEVMITGPESGVTGRRADAFLDSFTLTE